MGIGRVAAGASLSLLLTRIVDGGSGSCDANALLDLRGQWASKDEPCYGKLSFDLWLLMKAEGSNPSAAAQGVLDHCVALDQLQLLELSIAEGQEWDIQTSKGYSGKVVSRCACSASVFGASVTDLEAICEDDGISRAARVSPIHDRHLLGSPEHVALRKRRHRRRRLQATTSEAVAAHEVDVLIAGLEELGCANTKGDGQVICAMSDSFNATGYADLLRAQGDLPKVHVVKDNPDGTDEGSATIELAYDIAPNAEYKFHTTSFGEQAFTDAILDMAATEGCDIMVDDISYPQEPSFRDGIIAQAVDTIVEEHGVLSFMSAANDGLALRFTTNFECTTTLYGADRTEEPCEVGVATHVFDDTLAEDDIFRYLYLYDIDSPNYIYVKWDEDEDAARNIALTMWLQEADGTPRVLAFATNMIPGRATTGINLAVVSGSTAPGVFFSVQQMDDTPSDLSPMAMHIITRGGDLTGAKEPSMYGSQCASGATSVAAIHYALASGPNGVFADPETSLVESFSSRGGCLVRTDGVLEERNKPETTAADRLATSTPGFEKFAGTSAAAPVAAAIVTLVRAACAPERVVGRAEVLEMLSNYDYTIDYTSDADGEAETFGGEAGYGIISASKMLAWVEENCAAACPGGQGSDSSEQSEVSEPSSDDSEQSDVSEPSSDDSEQSEVSQPSSDDSEQSEVSEPSSDDSEQSEALEPSSDDSEQSEVSEPSSDDSEQSDVSGTSSDDEYGWHDDESVEVSVRTTVEVSANGYDDNSGSDDEEGGCGLDGCLPELTRDGDISNESRWSCARKLVTEGDECEITFEFGEKQNVRSIEFYLYQHGAQGDDEFPLEVIVNGDVSSSCPFDPSEGSITCDVEETGVKSLSLRSVDIDDEWMSLREVLIFVGP